MVNQMSMVEERRSTWWRSRTNIEKTLMLILVLSVILIIGIFAGLIALLLKNNNLSLDITKKEDMCLTPSCIDAASKLLKDLDVSVDPCEDFYQFSCGNFLKTSEIPEDQFYVGMVETAQKKLLKNLQAAVEKPTQKNEPKSFQLIKSFHKSCMDLESIEKENLDTIQKIMKELGGWPVLEGSNWVEEDFEWTKTDSRLKNAGLAHNFFISLYIKADYKNSKKHIIYLSPSQTERPPKLLKKFNNNTDPYYKFMVNVAILFGADKDRAEKEMKHTFIFHSTLEKMITHQILVRNFTALYNPMTIAELHQKYPSVPWLQYLNNMLGSDNQITNNEIVIVQSPKYFKEFDTFINSTSKKVQANYMFWRAVHSAIPHLTEKLRTVQLDYHRVLGAQKVFIPRSCFCLRLISAYFTSLSNALYMEQYFNKNVEEYVSKMIANLKSVYSKRLMESNWLDEKTKKRALEKLESMNSIIGYPHELLGVKYLEDHYKDLKLDEKHYFKSILNINIFNTRTKTKCLRKSTSSIDCADYGSVEVNAYYNDMKNQIRICLGYLEEPYFDINRPLFMNYAIMGSTIGHEISHGFDDQGRQIDKNGNLSNWWTPKAEETFLKKAQCYISQYGNCTEPRTNMKVNGFATQSENIADNAGIKTSYLAYVKWVEDHGEESGFPGMSYNVRQLFWISAANAWCLKSTKYMAVFQMVEAHSPDRFRINVPFSNSAYFARDFNCSLGSAMNPRKKCDMW